MSASTTEQAASPGSPRLALFWESTIGKKATMALSGLLLFAYVLAHLLGNLQIYKGGDAIDAYARFLHSSTGLLWAARVVLAVAVSAHAVAGVQLWLLRRAARPVQYRARENIQATAASRTMLVTGLTLAAFVVYHVLDLTVGLAHVGPFVDLVPSANVVTGFSHACTSSLYVVAMIALGFHLWHGVYAAFGSLGLTHPRYTDGVKRLAAVFAVLVVLGNVSFPVAVLTGLLRR